MLTYHLYLLWVSEIRFKDYRLKNFFFKDIFLSEFSCFAQNTAITAFLKRKGEEETPYLCSVDKISLNGSHRCSCFQVSLPWMGLGTNCIANLCCVVYQPSVTQESTHVCLPETDLQHKRSAPGLGSEQECLD